MGEGNIFGSGELTPELVRGATFAQHDGRYDAAEVNAFLDQIASAIGVFMSGDAPTALRAEFARNAEIAQQVLDAGQAASEQLRRQAEEETRAIVARAQQQAEDEASALRDGVAADIARSRAQVVELRDQFINDLRDVYDRIGASLYRFEKANAEEQLTPIEAPRAPSAPQSPTAPSAAEGWADSASESGTMTFVADSPSDEPEFTPPPAAGWGSSTDVEIPETTSEFELNVDTAGGSWLDLPADAQTEAIPAETIDEAGHRPPAWTQLPAEAWSAEPPQATPAANIELGDPFEPVIEDEPLAPGEPLVDLRDFGAPTDVAPDSFDAPAPAAGPTSDDFADDAAPSAGPEPATGFAPADLPADVDVTHEPLGHGESVFSDHVELAEEPAAIATPNFLDLPPPSPEPVNDGGWLDGPTDPVHEDARAEALLAGTAGIDPTASAPAPPPTIGSISGQASPDALAVRQLILDSLAAGQTREAIEQYLERDLGLMAPAALVDAALAGS